MTLNYRHVYSVLELVPPRCLMEAYREAIGVELGGPHLQAVSKMSQKELRAAIVEVCRYIPLNEFYKVADKLGLKADANNDISNIDLLEEALSGVYICPFCGMQSGEHSEECRNA